MFLQFFIRYCAVLVNFMTRRSVLKFCGPAPLSSIGSGYASMQLTSSVVLLDIFDTS